MENNARTDLISRQVVKDALVERTIFEWEQLKTCYPMLEVVDEVPPAQPEQLTDKEQRIFLAAMEREEKVCEEVDRNYVREPYEDSLMSVCREIKRKVKGALWTR